jgi:hypothetical protein
MDAREREQRVRELLAQELSENAIARISGIPRRTVGRIIKRLGEERQQADAAEVGAKTTAPPASVEALPHIARQLYNAALRIYQVDAQQLRDAEVRVRQAQEAVPQALQALQAVRAEQREMRRDVMQSLGELHQASEQLLQLLSGESHKSDEEVTPMSPGASHGVSGRHDSEPRRVPPWREPPQPTPETGQPPPQT